MAVCLKLEFSRYFDETYGHPMPSHFENGGNVTVARFELSFTRCWDNMKTVEIRMLVKELGIHILALNETKLDKSIDDSLVNIEGYTIIRHDRDRHEGGVAIYLKDTLLDKTTVREDLPNSALELICVEIKPIHAASFVVLAWYRLPNVSFDIFNQIEECLQFLDREDKRLFF